MKKCFLLFLTVITFLFVVQEEPKADKGDLPERYKKWLEEEVVYIIVPLEKEVFLQLKTDRERDLFIEAFWKQRDPTPGTPENEFKNEHYRRISHANHFFGRGTPKPGWRTDRGRVYIILGEPNDVEQFEGKTATYPSVIWFYQGKTPLGLPPGFNLVFFQEGGIGEYRLYSPLKDGPQALMTSYWGDPANYVQAYEQLRELEPGLAEVSLSLIPGEAGAVYGRPSLSSDLLIQKVESTPTREVKDRYAQKFLQYKDIVEVEYSTNYIGNDSLVEVIKDPSGLYFVHYAIEPEILSVSQYENTFSTNLKLNGTVADSEGGTIYQFEWEIPLRFDQEQMKNVMVRPFSIRDMFPLIPGEYNLSILVKNEVSKEFTSLERKLIIPEEEGLQMTSLMLGYSTSRKKASEQRLRPFQIGNDQIFLQTNRVFLRQDNLVVAFQVHGLGEELKERSQLKFTFFKMGEEFRTFTRTLDQYPDFPNIMESFSLPEFLPDHYRIQASILVDNQEVLFDSQEFDITHSEVIARPILYQKLLVPSSDPVYSYLIGIQLFNSGKVEEAKARLQEAFHKKPDNIDFAFNLARAHMKLAEYKEIEAVLLPFLSRLENPPYELLFMMGIAYQNMGKLDKAIEVFDQAISQYGLNLQLLNSLGECYFQLGNAQEALAAWEKSLEINPNQPQIKKNVETLKKKK
jgi:GWxTD domain-containing protein